ncbi:antibiotic biosynthesis monooxygenase [Psychromonas sp.]|uniref:antibiotic biosynthesis monooxygenase family protein n=1 Tax=Psychromonas sp. TaxID=1884585 RepID=UPI00356156CC
MIYVLFRWELKPGSEQSFKEGWTEIIHRNIEKYGALGSRLHKTKDNQWISYSHWISEEHFNHARNLHDQHEEARVKMINAIAKAYPPIVMVPVLDNMVVTDPAQPQLYL